MIKEIKRPVFVVGAMRSGTTIISEILGQHYHINHCRFELKDIWSKIGGISMASPKTRDLRCEELGAESYAEYMKLNLTRAFISRMYDNAAGKSEDALFLNKNPHLCNKIPLVQALFPDAKFIWIRRNIVRVVASLVSLFKAVCERQKTWHFWPEVRNGVTNRCWNAFHYAFPEGVDKARCFPGGDIRYLCEYWYESNRAVAKSFSLHPESFIQITHEKFLEDPQGELNRCLDFLQLDKKFNFDLGMLSNDRNDIWKYNLDSKSIEICKEFLIEIYEDKEECHQFLDDAINEINAMSL